MIFTVAAIHSTFAIVVSEEFHNPHNTLHAHTDSHTHALIGWCSLYNTHMAPCAWTSNCSSKRATCQTTQSGIATHHVATCSGRGSTWQVVQPYDVIYKGVWLLHMLHTLGKCIWFTRLDIVSPITVADLGFQKQGFQDMSLQSATPPRSATEFWAPLVFVPMKQCIERMFPKSTYYCHGSYNIG